MEATSSLGGTSNQGAVQQNAPASWVTWHSQADNELRSQIIRHVVSAVLQRLKTVLFSLNCEAFDLEAICCLLLSVATKHEYCLWRRMYSINSYCVLRSVIFECLIFSIFANDVGSKSVLKLRLLQCSCLWGVDWLSWPLRSYSV